MSDELQLFIYCGHCRDLELVSSLPRVHNIESLPQSNVCNLFCLGLSCCPYYRGFRYRGVSARRELAVILNFGAKFQR